MEFLVLGPLEVVDGAAVRTVAAAGQRTLLAVLVRHAGTVVSVDRLAEALWDEHPPRTARHSVHTQVSRLRRAGGLDDVLRTHPPGYLLAVPDEQVDARRFERLLGSARRSGDPWERERLLAEALSLWRGPAYAGLADSPLLRGEAVRLEDLRAAALELHADALLATGRAPEAVGELEALVAHEPLREAAWATLMRALAGTGRPAQALQAFRRYREHVVAEGLLPSATMEGLQRAVLRGEVRPAALPRSAAATSARERRTDRLLERADALALLDGALEQAAAGSGQVVLVPGEPGIGKTALVRALPGRLPPGSRLLTGSCDDLVTPRPLAPLADMRSLPAEVSEALLSPARPATAHRLLLDELDRAPGPTVLVVEDLHWADEATLDLLTQLVRRLSTVRALLVLTYRDTELAGDHPLRRVLGSVPPAIAREVRLEPLSLAAVTELVGDARAAQVLALSGGNPFFVTELAAAPAADVPPSVRSAVLARLAHLPPATRDVLGLVAVAPTRLECAVLDAVRPDWADRLAPAERQGVVLVEDGAVRFRHELARRAVLGATPGAERRRLHLDLLPVLVERQADAARIVHHAEAAADEPTLATFALQAARSAAALGAHREAHAHFRRALRSVRHLPAENVAAVLEEASREAYLSDHEPEALRDATAALARYELAGDLPAAGRMHREISRLHWFGGRGAAADSAAHRALEVLEPLGPSVELAWAYSTLSQLAMLASRTDEAEDWGTRALDLAGRLGDDAVRAHALVNLGLARHAFDPDDERPLQDAVAVADAAGEHHEAARALLGLAGGLMEANRLPRATAVGLRALSYAEEHQVEALAHYVAVTLARVDVLAGRWEDAERRLRAAMETGGVVVAAFALGTLALLQVRRGDDDAAATLARAWEQALPTDELQRLGPLAALEAERAWLRGELAPESRGLRSCFAQALPRHPTLAGELARWLHAAGGLTEVPQAVDVPYRFELAGRWEAAARAWAERGMPYDQALCLARSPHGRAEALAVAERLGAAPLADRLRRPPAPARRREVY